MLGCRHAVARLVMSLLLLLLPAVARAWHALNLKPKREESSLNLKPKREESSK